MMIRSRIVCSRSRSSCIRRHGSTLKELQDQVRSGTLQPDVGQEQVAKKLTRLQEALIGYDNSVLFHRRYQRQQQRRQDELPPPPPSPPEKKQKKEKEEIMKSSDDDSNVILSDKNNTKEETKASSVILKIPRGLYIYGKVGTGKSMLMDSFYNNVQLVAGGDDLAGGDDHRRKERIHFHKFLSNVHIDIHRLKREDLRAHGRNFTVDTSLENNPIHKVGLQLASKLSLLCLDEFQVTDIADAVILLQLFSVLFRMGTVVVATSNRPPQDLYEGGLNRSYFLQFIDVLERHCIIQHIPSHRDYRRTLANCSSFFVSSCGYNTISDSSSGSSIAVDDNDSIISTDDNDCSTSSTSKGNYYTQIDYLVSKLYTELIVGEERAEGDVIHSNNKNNRSMNLPVTFSRNINVDRVYSRETIDNDDTNNHENESRYSSPIMARFSFTELCDTEKGAQDYRVIAESFDIVIIEDIPTLDFFNHNRARRFITLIDELYEGKCALLCSALDAKTPMDIFKPSKDDASNEKFNQKNINVDGVGDDSGSVESNDTRIEWIDVSQQGGALVGAHASVRELAFAFERASSRIFEMCSQSWWYRVLDSDSSFPSDRIIGNYTLNGK